MPLRLNSWLASKGGVKDPGGDVYSLIGGFRGRPGLINNARGMTLDDAAVAAWEAGYFFGPERPTINDLLDAIEQDHNGRIPVFAEHDFDAVADARTGIASTHEDPHGAMLRRLVEAWRAGGQGKRKALRELFREAEELVA